MNFGQRLSPARACRWLRQEISRTPLAMAFLILVFPLGIFMVFVVPAGQVPDETAHIVRADALLHGEFAGFRQISTAPDGRTVVNAGVDADPALVWTSFGWTKPVTATDFAAKTNLHWTRKPIFLRINPLAVYFPVFYAPSAIGIAVAQLAGARPQQAFMAARLASYLTFVALAVLALTAARRGKAIIFVTLSIPMTLSLGASCNPDGLLIASAALAVALITRGARQRAAVCLAAVILVKPPYALLALLLLWPWPNPRLWLADPAFRKRAGLAALAVLPGAIWFIYTMLAIAAPTPHPAYHPGPLWPGNPAAVFYATNPAAQLHVLCAHLFGSLGLVWTSIVTNPWLLKETIGILGYQNVVLTPAMYDIWMIAAAGALLADLLDETRPGAGWLDPPLLAMMIAASVYLIWISQYLNWTMVGLNGIDGPAGRYLLPLIPALGLALPRLGIRNTKWLTRIAQSLPILASAITFLLLPRWLVTQFYIH